MTTVAAGKERGPGELDALFARAGLRRTRILPDPAFASLVKAVAAWGGRAGGVYGDRVPRPCDSPARAPGARSTPPSR
ncbi:hypothetical protein GCM10010211_40430 [Streptomyces albospinus]|uniref:Uncharacterized protein n=1 Tax=Streptomyces albospinus TaxID=285515 RepID=A0ABQ2V843_9ACTN|nr:hypothetical protein GCM10010211_40430 [Streptomyces albospinus]